MVWISFSVFCIERATSLVTLHITTSPPSGLCSHMRKALLRKLPTAISVLCILHDDLRLLVDGGSSTLSAVLSACFISITKIYCELTNSSGILTRSLDSLRNRHRCDGSHHEPHPTQHYLCLQRFRRPHHALQPAHLGIRREGVSRRNPCRCCRKCMGWMWRWIARLGP